MHLGAIRAMRARWDVPVGLSDHTLGDTAAIAAVALGACIVEKHFKAAGDDASPDAAFSLDPDGFRRMVDAIRFTESAVAGTSVGPAEAELESRRFRRSLFVVEDVAGGRGVHRAQRALDPTRRRAAHPAPRGGPGPPRQRRRSPAAPRSRGTSSKGASRRPGPSVRPVGRGDLVEGCCHVVDVGRRSCRRAAAGSGAGRRRHRRLGTTGPDSAPGNTGAGGPGCSARSRRCSPRAAPGRPRRDRRAGGRAGAGRSRSATRCRCPGPAPAPGHKAGRRGAPGSAPRAPGAARETSPAGSSWEDPRAAAMSVSR